MTDNDWTERITEERHREMAEAIAQAEAADGEAVEPITPIVDEKFWVAVHLDNEGGFLRELAELLVMFLQPGTRNDFVLDYPEGGLTVEAYFDGDRHILRVIDKTGTAIP